MTRALLLSCLVAPACGDPTVDPHYTQSGDSHVVSKQIFVTSDSWSGDLAGLAGADTLCQTAADAANLTGSWRAWLSDASTDAIDHIQGDGPWRLVGTAAIVFATHAQLEFNPSAPIDRDELGLPNAGNGVWTGTGPGGRAGDAHCSSWSSAAGTGLVGLRVDDSAWTGFMNEDCSRSSHLYCLQQ